MKNLVLFITLLGVASLAMGDVTQTGNRRLTGDYLIGGTLTVNEIAGVPSFTDGISSTYSGNWTSIGTVGAYNNLAQALSDSDFPTPANVHYYHFAGDVLDDSGNTAAPFAPVGVTYDAKGFFARANSVRFAAPEDDYLSNSSLDLKPDVGVDYTVGGWFYADWSPSGTQYLFAGSGSTTDRGIQCFLLTTPQVRCTDSANGTSDAVILGFDPPSWDWGWHHIVMRFDFSATEACMFIDGQRVDCDTLTNTRTPSSTFRVAGRYSIFESATSLEGAAQDFFFNDSEAYSDDVINQIYSRRFSGEQLAGGHVLAASSFPFTGLTGKVAFWNLNSTSQLTDGSGNGLTLTNDTAVAFDALSIFGETGIADFPGGHGFKVVDSFFDIGSVSGITMGGWYRAKNWPPDTTSDVITYLGSGGGDRAAGLFVTTAGALQVWLTDTSDCLTPVSAFTSPVVPWQAGEWHHVVGSWDGTQYHIYTDGVLFASAEVSLTPCSTTVDQFNIGGYYGNYLGQESLQEIFFARAELSAWDIKKLASSKLLPGVTVNPEYQSWVGTWKREDGHIYADMPMGWILGKKSTQLFLFPGLDAGDQIKLLMQQVR